MIKQNKKQTESGTQTRLEIAKYDKHIEYYMKFGSLCLALKLQLYFVLGLDNLYPDNTANC